MNRQYLLLIAIIIWSIVIGCLTTMLSIVNGYNILSVIGKFVFY
jgi:hypothetical protein